MKNLIFLILVSVCFLGCEKAIDFNLKSSQPTLVVEGNIENGLPPKVILSKSIDYYGELSPAVLQNSYVHNAEVYISNGTLTHKLKEYSNTLFPGFDEYYYSIDSTNLNTAFLGQFNTAYQLRIVVDGNEYLSSTNIPALNVVPDSVYFKPAPNNSDSNKRVMFLKISDPQGLGNYIRYFTKKNSEPFYPGPNSVFTDEIIDGTTFTIQLEQGYNKNNPPNPGENFFLKNDTITVKYSNISRSTYLFWNTWEFANQSIGNPFSQPNKVIGNISNGALGAFCGYASFYKTIIIQ
jgi:hypothetical protein